MTEEFIEALADCHTAGLIDLNALRAQCLSVISAGGGMVAFTTRAGLNGKAAEQECKLSADVLLPIVGLALAQASGTRVSLTYSDFSQIPNA